MALVEGFTTYNDDPYSYDDVKMVRVEMTTVEVDEFLDELAYFIDMDKSPWLIRLFLDLKDAHSG